MFEDLLKGLANTAVTLITSVVGPVMTPNSPAKAPAPVECRMCTTEESQQQKQAPPVNVSQQTVVIETPVTHSHDKVEIKPTGKVEDKLEERAKELEEKAILEILNSSNEVLAKPVEADLTCTDTQPYTLKEARRNYEASQPFFAGRKVRRFFSAIPIEGTEKEIDYLTQIIGELAFPEWKARAMSCRDYFCALVAAYNSEEIALRSASIFARFGYYLTVNKDYSIDKTELKWNELSVRTIEKALEMLPSSFYKMPRLQLIIPFSSQQQTAVNEALGLKNANAAGGYFGSWSVSKIKLAIEGSESYLKSIVIHELAHAFSFSYLETELKNSNSVLAQFIAMNWEHSFEDKTAVKKNEGRFVSDYAKTNPSEDFAESIAHFVLNGERLKKLNPMRYELIRTRIFKGREYSGESTISTDGLKPILKEKGGCASVAERCVSQLGRDWVSQGSRYIYDVDQSYGYQPKDLASQSRCYEKLINEWMPQFDKVLGPSCGKYQKDDAIRDLKQACEDTFDEAIKAKYGEHE
jgi:hypothetical protein